MDLMKVRNELLPLQPREAASMLQALPVHTLQGLQDHAMLVTALGLRLRIRETLAMTVDEAEGLSEALVQALTQTYYAAMKQRYCVLGWDNAFPALHIRERGQVTARSNRSFVLTLKLAADGAGIDPDRIDQGTWRQLAYQIHSRPGGFAAFVSTFAPFATPGNQY
jgi:hypothetical protein